MNDLHTILQQLGHSQAVCKKFDDEEVTLDMVNSLTQAEMSSLGIRDIGKINALRQRCHLHGAMGNDRMKSPEDLKKLLELNFSVAQIAEMYGMSQITVRRRMCSFGLTGSKYTDISEAELADAMSQIMEVHKGIGEKMMNGFLRARHIRVQRHRIRELMRELDTIGVEQRGRRSLHRRVYSVPHANALWHIDGNHKLIRWGFVIHGGVDGYSRLPVFLVCATDNCAQTVLKAFSTAVAQYGWPVRVRADCGGENVDVANLMESNFGNGSIIQGRSVHNQRIERLWRDLFNGCTSVFYHLFYKLEDENKLDINNPIHQFCLRFIFLQRINDALNAWRHAWSMHTLRTTSMTPLQMFAISSNDNQLENSDVDFSFPTGRRVHRPHVIVTDTSNMSVSAQIQLRITAEINPQSSSSTCGIDMYERALAISLGV